MENQQNMHASVRDQDRLFREEIRQISQEKMQQINQHPEIQQSIHRLAAEIGLDGNDSRVRSAVVESMVEMGIVMQDPQQMQQALEKYRINDSGFVAARQKFDAEMQAVEQHSIAFEKKMASRRLIQLLTGLVAGVFAFIRTPKLFKPESSIRTNKWQKFGAGAAGGILGAGIVGWIAGKFTTDPVRKEYDAFVEKVQGQDLQQLMTDFEAQQQGVAENLIKAMVLSRIRPQQL